MEVPSDLTGGIDGTGGTDGTTGDGDHPGALPGAIGDGIVGTGGIIGVGTPGAFMTIFGVLHFMHIMVGAFIAHTDMVTIDFTVIHTTEVITVIEDFTVTETLHIVQAAEVVTTLQEV